MKQSGKNTLISTMSYVCSALLLLSVGCSQESKARSSFDEIVEKQKEIYFEMQDMMHIPESEQFVKCNYQFEKIDYKDIQYRAWLNCGYRSIQGIGLPGYSNTSEEQIYDYKNGSWKRS